jgi:hypothetical protein
MSFESSHQQALAAIERGDTDEAVGLLLQAAAAGTLQGRVLNDLAVAMLAQSGEGERAEHLLRSALVVDPYYTDAMANLAALRPAERGPGVLVSFCNSTRTQIGLLDRETLGFAPLDIPGHRSSGIAGVAVGEHRCTP